MDLDKAMVKVAKVFLGLSEAPDLVQQLRIGQISAQDMFLKQKNVAREMSGVEPGCSVNYEAMFEKIKVIGPYLKATASGPGLIDFFTELRKLRQAWMVAFARYAAHAINGRMPQLKGVGKSPLASEHAAATFTNEGAILARTLMTKEEQLRRFKASRQFARSIHILEECIKKHKVHLQRKAHAEKIRIFLTRSRKAKVQKTKKGALGASKKAPHNYKPFNPDLPDFAQFMKDYASQSSSSSTRDNEHDLTGVDPACAIEQVLTTNTDREVNQITEVITHTDDNMGYTDDIPIDTSSEIVQMFQYDTTYQTVFPEQTEFGNDNASVEWTIEPQLDLDAMLGLNPNGSLMQDETKRIDPQLLSGEPHGCGKNNSPGTRDNVLPVWLDMEEEACFREIFGSG